MGWHLEGRLTRKFHSIFVAKVMRDGPTRMLHLLFVLLFVVRHRRSIVEFLVYHSLLSTSSKLSIRWDGYAAGG